ncbi:hypothetical protein C1H46_045526 [Malus baccata]|uniref:Uncharacterized protein n=1 Tax=Malus baccata TaxID=106549 RepID=A0A540K420_MALBA|nr:hypothetical protein C1H46_045526 [Malus baccata]
MNLKSGGEMVLQRNSMAKKHVVKPGSLELGSSFIDFGHDRRFSMKALPVTGNRSTRKRKNRGFVIVNELAGQYEDSFEDVKTVRNLSPIHIFDELSLDDVLYVQLSYIHDVVCCCFGVYETLS